MRPLPASLAVPAALAFLLVGGCASPPLTAYTPLDPAARDVARADQLNQQAAELLSREPARAEALLREALASDLYHGPAHNNLGVVFLRRGKLYEAAGEFEWARKLLPGHPDPRLNLSLVFEAAGRADEALAHVNTALQVQPGHIASLQQRAKLLLRASSGSDVAAGSERSLIRDQLREISLRGESPAWRDWARLQLIKVKGKD